MWDALRLRFATFLILLPVLWAGSSLVHGQPAIGTGIQTVIVDPSQSQSIVVQVNPGLPVNFNVSVQITGGNNDINIFVTDPSGATVVTPTRVTSGSRIQFRTSEKGGPYAIHFDNTFSQSSKTIVARIDAGFATAIPGFLLETIVIGFVAGLLVLFSLRKLAVHPRPVSSHQTSSLPNTPWRNG